MQSLQELYKIGNGPSSSHTMGPKRATEMFKNKYPNADKFKVILYGSLAMTGKGHLTTTEVNQRILNVLEQAIQEDGIIDIFKAAERSNPEISILSEEYLEGIKKSKNKNIAAELLRRLIDGNIRVFKRTNLVKSELFSQKMV